MEKREEEMKRIYKDLEDQGYAKDLGSGWYRIDFPGALKHMGMDVREEFNRAEKENK